MNQYEPRSNPLWRASLGVSVRKVSNGYSVKINHSMFPEEVGRILVADGQKEVFKVLKDLFDRCDKEEQGGAGQKGYFGEGFGDPAKDGI